MVSQSSTKNLKPTENELELDYLLGNRTSGFPELQSSVIFLVAILHPSWVRMS